MKKLLFSITAFTLSTVLFAQDVQKKKAEDVAKFKVETIDLGKIQQGNPTTATFNVVNIGTEPLLIEQANPTCGCTISKYTKEPIASGKSGEIMATYNAATIGAFEKHLTVKFAGVDEIKSITIKGEVVAKDGANQAAVAPAVVPATTEKTTAPVKAVDTKATTKATVKKTTKTKAVATKTSTTPSKAN
jgi:hypothetical protein